MFKRFAHVETFHHAQDKKTLPYDDYSWSSFLLRLCYQGVERQTLDPGSFYLSRREQEKSTLACNYCKALYLSSWRLIDYWAYSDAYPPSHINVHC